ncbi:hypothetical protein [Escherichia phage phiWec177]|uniref:Uncharacterized protein n=1 Tax=Escherichia phage phiWec172 TaxID=2992777 RepID=A0ACA8S8N9_9CAUD|nr:hypothetical protein [Escherichia phage phiWec172]BDU11768.1 hypothetical protein [Escherichia phage phiWec174]BDU11926.1 hypothetical protein [Escherichia phage phiWec177]
MQAYWIEILLSLSSVAVFVYLLCKYYAEYKKCDYCNGKGIQEQVVALCVVVLVKCLISNLTVN